MIGLSRISSIKDHRYIVWLGVTGRRSTVSTDGVLDNNHSFPGGRVTPGTNVIHEAGRITEGPSCALAANL